MIEIWEREGSEENNHNALYTYMKLPKNQINLKRCLKNFVYTHIYIYHKTLKEALSSSPSQPIPQPCSGYTKQLWALRYCQVSVLSRHHQDYLPRPHHTQSGDLWNESPEMANRICLDVEKTICRKKAPLTVVIGRNAFTEGPEVQSIIITGIDIIMNLHETSFTK